MKPKIIIAGGTGFMGDALTHFLTRKGYEVVVLSRHHHVDTESVRYRKWDGASPGSWTEELEGAKAVINLCGRSVDCRYNQKNREAIYDSRLKPTRALGKAIAACATPPEVWLNGSTATYYRHATDRPMTEREGEAGEGFSVDVASKWEEAFYSADLPNTRKVALRTAIVLGNGGGALTPLLRLVRLALGGWQGSGKQMVSWIHILDFCRAVYFLINSENSVGGYNLSAPEPLPNRKFMKTLKRGYGHFIGMPAPAWLLKIGAVVIGTEAELMLKSRWVLPERLLEEGFTFQYPDLPSAVKALREEGRQQQEVQAIPAWG